MMNPIIKKATIVETMMAIRGLAWEWDSAGTASVVETVGRTVWAVVGGGVWAAVRGMSQWSKLYIHDDIQVIIFS